MEKHIFGNTTEVNMQSKECKKRKHHLHFWQQIILDVILSRLQVKWWTEGLRALNNWWIGNHFLKNGVYLKNSMMKYNKVSTGAKCFITFTLWTLQECSLPPSVRCDVWASAKVFGQKPYTHESSSSLCPEFTPIFVINSSCPSCWFSWPCKAKNSRH